MMRNAEKKDLVKLLQTDQFQSIDIPDFIESDMFYYLNHHPKEFFVYEYDHRIVGYVFGRVTDRLIDYDRLEPKGKQWLLIVGLGMAYDQEDKQLSLIYHMMEQASLHDLQGCLLIKKKENNLDLKKIGFQLYRYPHHQGWIIYKYDFQRINLTKLSRYISFVLRHHPEEIGATVDEQGWMKVDELLHGMQAKGKYINRAILENIVLTDEKQRYHYNEDHTKIRAAQGHSIPVYIDMESKVPPHYLYHGTSKQNYEKIKETKIKKMNRLYVHLSKDVTTACQVGKRHGIPVVLVLDTKAMLQDGYQFYVAANGVWLCDDVDCRYIVKVIEIDDMIFPGE